MPKSPHLAGTDNLPRGPDSLIHGATFSRRLAPDGALGRLWLCAFPAATVRIPELGASGFLAWEDVIVLGARSGDQVAPSDIAVGDEIQCPRTKNWFVVCGIRVSFMPRAKPTLGQRPWAWDCDVYYVSGADGELVTFFEGQQLVHRAVAAATGTG